MVAGLHCPRYCPSYSAANYGETSKHPGIFPAGDSTTKSEGGWGDGLLNTLRKPAFGINNGVSGRTTRSYVSGGYWKEITDYVTQYAGKNKVYVTISVSDNLPRPSHTLMKILAS